MADLEVGIRSVAIYLRHATSLKDKRQVLRSIIQKLRNEGFTAVEYGYPEDHKRALIGFAFVAEDAAFIDGQFEKAKRFFVGDFEVLDTKTQVLQLSDEVGPDAWAESKQSE